MPFSNAYGPPIGAQRANAVIEAAAAEASKRGWPMNIAVVDSGANLVAFLRMDDAQLASIAIAEHKARAAAKFRRPTKVFEDVVQKFDFKYILTLDDVVASRGGIPLIEGGKIIDAVGCSGALARRMRWSARQVRLSSTSSRVVRRRLSSSAPLADQVSGAADPSDVRPTTIGRRDLSPSMWGPRCGIE